MIPLYKPYMPSELPDLQSILHSGELSYGKYGKIFEQKLRSFLDVDQLLTVNSFNSAVLVALITLGVKSGDEVIASPMACLASNQPLLTIGAKVIWADIDPATGTLDPDSVREKISSKTKVIFHNHFCGYPGYIDEINRIASDHGITVIDDAIEAFGSNYKGKLIGNSGTDVTIFSFQAVRLPTTIDGGVVVFKDKNLFEKSLLVRDSGIDRRYFRDDLGEISSAYDIKIEGFAATMSDVNSYIGIMQMNDIEKLISIQRRNGLKWTEWFNDNSPDYRLMNERKENNPNYWIFGVLADNKSKAIRRFRDMGYYASGVHFNNNEYSVFGEKQQLKGVSEFYDRFVALPCGWWFEKD